MTAPARLAAREEYRKAAAAHRVASKAMVRAERLFRKLARTMPDDNAYKIADVKSADERDLRSYAVEQKKLAALIASVEDASSVEAVMAKGVWLCTNTEKAIERG